MRQTEIMIDGVEVQFLDPDNIEQEKVFRLIAKKFAKIAVKLAKSPDVASVMELNVDDLPLDDIFEEILDDADFEKVRDIMLSSLIVQGIGNIGSREKLNILIQKKGFHFMYLLIWRSCMNYLGEHLSMFLASGSIPPKVKAMLTELLEKMKSFRLSGLQSSEDTPTIDPQ